MKKSFMKFVIAICLVVPSMLMLTACGGGKPPLTQTSIPLTESMVSLDKTIYEYTGSSIEPQVTVTVNNNIIDSSEYIVSYVDNIEKTKQAKVIVTAKEGSNIIEGSVTVNFTILGVRRVLTIVEFREAIESADNLDVIRIEEDIVLSEGVYEIPSNINLIVSNNKTMTIDNGCLVNILGTLQNDGKIITNEIDGDVTGTKATNLNVANYYEHRKGDIVANITKEETLISATNFASTIKITNPSGEDKILELTKTFKIENGIKLVIGNNITLTGSPNLFSQTIPTASQEGTLITPIVELYYGTIEGEGDSSIISGNIHILASLTDYTWINNLKVVGNVHLLQNDETNRIRTSIKDTTIVGVKEILEDKYLPKEHNRRYAANASAITINEQVSAYINIEGVVDVLGWYNAAGIGVHCDSSLTLRGSVINENDKVGTLVVTGNKGLDEITQEHTDYDVAINVNGTYSVVRNFQGGSGIGAITSYGPDAYPLPVGDIYIKSLLSLTVNGYGYNANGIGGTLFDSEGNMNDLVIENTTIDYVRGGWVDTPMTKYNTGTMGGAGIGSHVYYVYEQGTADEQLVNIAQKVVFNKVEIKCALGGGLSAGIGAGAYAGVDLTIIDSIIQNVKGGICAAAIGGGRVDDYQINYTVGDEESKAAAWQKAQNHNLAPIYINIENSTISNVLGGTYGAGIGNGYDTNTHEIVPVVDGDKIYGKAQEVVINIDVVNLEDNRLTNDNTNLLKSIITNITGGNNAAGIGLGYQSCNLVVNIGSEGDSLIDNNATLLYNINGGTAHKTRWEIGLKFADGDKVDSIGFGNVLMHRGGIKKSLYTGYDANGYNIRNENFDSVDITVSTNWFTFRVNPEGNYDDPAAGLKVQTFSEESKTKTVSVLCAIQVLDDIIYRNSNNNDDTLYQNDTVIITVNGVEYIVRLEGTTTDEEITLSEAKEIIQNYIQSNNVDDIINTANIKNYGIISTENIL